MVNIREGNDFVWAWAVMRGGVPEPLDTATDVSLTATVFGHLVDVPFSIVGVNSVVAEFTPDICSRIGVYNLKLTYSIPDDGLSDGMRECATDYDAFKIVSRTAQASTSSEFSVTTDMAIAFKGDKGDKGDMPDIVFSMNGDGELEYEIINI